MLTGSFASSVHGMPRATRDIDIIIVPTREQLTRLIEQFPQMDYYASLDEAVDALERKSQFNVIDLTTGWKIDFIIRRDREFSQLEFSRRSMIPFAGTQLYVASAEDILIAKLECAKQGGSERQIEDAAGIISSQAEALETSYIERWARELGLEEQLRSARKKAFEGLLGVQLSRQGRRLYTCLVARGPR